MLFTIIAFPHKLYEYYLKTGQFRKDYVPFLVEDVATDLILLGMKGKPIWFTIVLSFKNPSFVGKLLNVEAHSAVQLHNDDRTIGLQVGLQSAGEIVLENWRRNNPKSDKLFYAYSKKIDILTLEKVFYHIFEDIKKEYIYKRVPNPKDGTVNCTTWAVKIAKIAGFEFTEFDNILFLLRNSPYDLYLRLKGKKNKEEWYYHRYAKQA